ncbi:uncharacterized protein LOC141604929 [Silene latifolia]|uniref:uncharacterized protein LOC141604929 n=1 Tax=Silene latifolia TaxID=37657 RepID=UPI003D775BBA
MTLKFLSCTYVQNLILESGSKGGVKTWRNGSAHLNAALHYCSEAFHEQSLPLEWYRENYPRLIKLSNLLKNVDLVDKQLIDINDDSTVNDERLLRRMYNFKALSRAFLGNPSVQEEVIRNMKAAMAGRQCNPPVCFTKPIEREPITIDTFTKVCNLLNISAQQRKTVRVTISPQITQHRIWTGVLVEILQGLKTEIELLDRHHSPSKGTFMGQQIVATCLKFLGETACRQDEITSSWMRPKAANVPDSPSSRKWEEVLEMFRDLINYLKHEEDLAFHVSKLEAMKEGLSQIKDVVIDRDIGYKEVQHRESLVQKRLLKTLGHSSRCLFTLLRYYLHQTIRDMEVEVSGGLCEIGEKDRLCLCMGKFLTSVEENMIWSGIKQLDRALRLFKFVWDTARVERQLELQGHLWCVGAESRTINYRGNLFFLHGINP